MTKTRRLLARSVRATVMAVALGGGIVVPAKATFAAANTIYVSTMGQPSLPGTSCITAKYASINAAIAAAAPGATVDVCAGTYPGGVVVTKPVTLVGLGANILAAGWEVGITVPAPGATVEGFVVRGAIGEGILVVGRPGKPVSGVEILHNVVEGNDTGNPTGAAISKSGYAECNAAPSKPPAPAVPGDCGEGIHLMVVSGSVVSGNTVIDNSGGILLSDEFGPTDHNTITANTVEYNVLDCGITVVSHSPKGFGKTGPVPSAGGTYDNTVSGNTIVGNGTAGQGGGVLLATALPGGAVYDNTVRDNVISANGLAGVTLHSHAPGQDLNGNVVEANTIGTNNIDGDYDFSPDVDALHSGVIVAAVSPVAITVSGNTITDNAYGIWSTGPVIVTDAGENTFQNVPTPVMVG